VKVLRKCTCGKDLTKDDVKFIGFGFKLPLYNCLFCGSTIVIKSEHESVCITTDAGSNAHLITKPKGE